MSDKIYFTSGKQRLISLLVYGLSQFAHCLSPERTLNKVHQLLLTPVRRKPHPLPEGMIHQRLSARNGDVQLYSLGSGPAWLLVHGWSGAASQYFPLMEKLAQAGYTAIAYDQIGHGDSGGQQTNLPCFVHTLEDVLSAVKPQHQLTGIIAHSMGAIAAINVLSDDDHPLPIALLAPAFSFKQRLIDQVTQAGIPRRLLEKILQRIEIKSGLSLADLHAEDKLPAYRGPLTIIHDHEDTLSPHTLSQSVAEEHQISLISTRGFGHSRLLKAEPVWQAILDFSQQQAYPVDVTPLEPTAEPAR